MAKGTVKWFNPTKGYGFIQPSGGGGRDVFVHISAVEKAGLSTLNEGQTVEYEEVSNKGKTSAENLKGRVIGKNCHQTGGAISCVITHGNGDNLRDCMGAAVRQARRGLMLLKASLERRRPCLTDLPMMKSAAKSSAFSCATGYRRAAYFSAMIFSMYATAIFSAG